MLNILKVTRMFVSDVRAKEGFCCIVFQRLVLADEGSLLLTCHLQRLWITVAEAVRWQKD